MADDVASLTEETLLDAVEEQLDAIDCAGSFSAQGFVSPGFNPGLHVEGVGGFGTPFYGRDVEALKQKARQAPFGKGEDTIIDITIRNTWEIDAEKISFMHPDWALHESAILDSVCTNLGVSGGSGNVKAQLYKLLIYEEGALFKPHKDSEKAPGMFATMVICLPSLHQGGDVIVTFGGESRTLPTSSTSEWGCSYLAWYADVMHEVRPIEQGTRVVLTYNLIFTGDTRFPSLEKLNEDKAGLRDTLRSWATADLSDLPKYLAYPLEHEYSESNLNLSHLKRIDKARATCILQIAGELGLYCFLGLLDKTMICQGDEDEDFEVKRNGDMSTKLLDLHGNVVLNHIRLPESIIAKTDPWEGHLYNEEEEFTGNAGVERTYWYKSCALLFMPRLNFTDLLLSKEYTCTGKASKIDAHFTKLQQQGAADQWDIASAARMCELVFEYGSKSRSRGESRRLCSDGYGDEFIIRLIDQCLQLGLLQVLLQALRRAKPDVAVLFIDRARAWLPMIGFEHLQTCLELALRQCDGISTRLGLLRRIEHGILPNLLPADFEQWKDTQTVVFMSLPLGNIRNVASELVDIICKTKNLSWFDDSILPAVSDDGKPKFLLNFASELLRQASAGNYEVGIACNVYEMHLPDILDGITYLPERPQYQGYMRAWRDYERDEQEKRFTAGDLIRLNDDLIEQQVEDQVEMMHHQVASQLPTLSPSLLETVMVPYLRDLVSLMKRRGVSFDMPSYQDLFINIVSNLVYRKVQPEPKPPSLRRSPNGCGCQYCQQIDAFLSSSHHESTQIVVTYKKDVAHLNRQYEQTRAVYRPRTTTDQFRIESQSYQQPYTFGMTKTNAAYEDDHRKWQQRAQETRQLIDGLADPVTLQQLLGHRFAELVQLHGVTLLRRLDGKVAEPTTYLHTQYENGTGNEHNEQAQNVQNVQSVPNNISLAMSASMTPQLNGSLKRKNPWDLDPSEYRRRALPTTFIDLSGSP